MKLAINKSILTLIATILLVACTNKKQDLIDETKLTNDNFEIKGKYTWSFDLMGNKHTSINTFYPDSIVYEMKGKVYSVNYAIHKISYNKQEGRWIGKDNKGIVYLHFLKNETDSTITIYKRKCKKGGLKEALGFYKPSDTTSLDYGWNVYTKS